MIDAQGRVFGRVNLIDLLVLVFVLGLLPVAYATYLLFRPATPAITSVERVEVSREERRVAGSSLVMAKLKVRGSGFSPMLRASVGNVPAIGFVFENPNSADVIVGEMPAGTFDLVLLDGVQEVARAASAYTVQATPIDRVRAAGYLVNLTPELSEAMRAGAAYPEADPRVWVVALGDAQRGHARLEVGGRVADVPTPDRLERPAVLTLGCDPRAVDQACTINGVPLTGDPVVSLPSAAGPVAFAVREVFPESPPHQMTVIVQAEGGAWLRGIRVNDREALLDGRAATVTAVRPVAQTSAGTTLELTLALGADASREGWRYRGQLLQPGGPISLVLQSLHVQGVVQRVVETGNGGS